MSDKKTKIIKKTNKINDVRNDDVRNDDVRNDDVKINDVKINDVKINDVRNDDVKIDDVKNKNIIKKPFEIFELKKIFPQGYLLWDIYRIVTQSFCPFRNITITSGDITMANFKSDMQFKNFVKIHGYGHDGTRYIISIVNSDNRGKSQIISKTDSLKSFMNIVNKNVDTIIIIGPILFPENTKKFIRTVETNIENYVYDVFKIVLPLCSHSSPSPYLLATEEEKNQILSNISTNNSIGKILKSDVQLAWYNFKVGDVIKIMVDNDQERLFRVI